MVDVYDRIDSMVGNMMNYVDLTEEGIASRSNYFLTLGHGVDQLFVTMTSIMSKLIPAITDLIGRIANPETAEGVVEHRARFIRDSYAQYAVAIAGMVLVDDNIEFGPRTARINNAINYMRTMKPFLKSYVCADVYIPDEVLIGAVADHVVADVTPSAGRSVESMIALFNKCIDGVSVEAE